MTTASNTWKQTEDARTETWERRIEGTDAMGYVSAYGESQGWNWQAWHGEFVRSGTATSRDEAIAAADSMLDIPVDEFKALVVDDLLNDMREIEAKILQLSPKADLMPVHHALAEEPAISARTLQNLRRRLEKWELEHLRRLAAELDERLERAEEEARRAWESAEFWRENAMELQEALMREDFTIGITKDGQMVAAKRDLSTGSEVRNDSVEQADGLAHEDHAIDTPQQDAADLHESSTNVTWPGDGNIIQSIDWSPLADRTAIVHPENSQDKATPDKP